MHIVNKKTSRPCKQNCILDLFSSLSIPTPLATRARKTGGRRHGNHITRESHTGRYRLFVYLPQLVGACAIALELRGARENPDLKCSSTTVVRAHKLQGLFDSYYANDNITKWHNDGEFYSYERSVVNVSAMISLGH